MLNAGTAGRLSAQVVAGAANNQLADDQVGQMLYDRRVLYAPDYVINAGGIINAAGEIAGRYDHDLVERRLQRIPVTLGEIFTASEARQVPTSRMADRLAKARLADRRQDRLQAA